MMNHLLFLFAFASLLEVGHSFTWPNASIMRNCSWSEWEGAKCTRYEKRSFRVRQTRVKFPAKNGGKDCTGSSYRYISCNEVQYTAQGFYDTIATASPAGRSEIMGIQSFSAFSEEPFSQQSGQNDPTGLSAINLHNPKMPTEVFRSYLGIPAKVVSLYNPCATPFYGASGSLRMGGKCVKQKRRRRRADGFIETVEEPEPALYSHNTRVKRTVILSRANRDILFLIDESASVGKENMKKEIRLAKTIVSKFCGNIDIGKEKTRVGIMTFDHRQSPQLNFDKYFDKPNIIKAMDRIEYKGGATCIVKALDFVLKEMITTTRGARNYEHGTERLVIFITDGCNECGNDTKLLQQLKDMQMTMEQEEITFVSYFIGTGNACNDKILALADGSRCHQYHRAENWAEVDAMTDYIRSQPCVDAWTIGQTCS